jgi:hypothetical protein
MYFGYVPVTEILQFPLCFEKYWNCKHLPRLRCDLEPSLSVSKFLDVDG